MRNTRVPGYVSSRAIACYFGVHRATVRGWVHRKQLRPADLCVGHVKFWKEGIIEELLNQFAHKEAV